MHARSSDLLPIPTPGKLLLEEFIKPAGCTQKLVAEQLGIPATRLNEVVKGRRRISAELSYRLGLLWRLDPHFWLHIQSDYDIRKLRRRRGAHLEKQVRPLMVPTA